MLVFINYRFVMVRSLTLSLASENSYKFSVYLSDIFTVDPIRV